jgi:DNA-binding CsgD family transcriptional regulator
MQTPFRPRILATADCLIEAHGVARIVEAKFDNAAIEISDARSLLKRSFTTYNMVAAYVGSGGSTRLVELIMEASRATNLIIISPNGKQDALDVESFAPSEISSVRRSQDLAELIVVRSDQGKSANARNLSEREAEVCLLISLGLTHKQIARRLSISPHTVDTYVKRAKSKLDTANKADITRAIMAFAH